MRITQLSRTACKKIGQLSGGASGIFNPGQEAQTIMPNANYGTLFAYLFRRFGMPNYGWDGHKMLVDYILTTPVKGAYLTVSPRPSGLIFGFGYLLDEETNKICNDEQYQPFREWDKEYKEWLLSKGINWIVQFGEDITTEKNKIVGDHWNKTHPEWNGINGGKEELNQWWAYNESENQKFESEFKLIKPYPVNKYDKALRRESFPEGSFRNKVNEALKYTISDLLRPVYVRDVAINACGLIDENNKLRPVSYHKEAGNGLQYFIEKAKAA